MKSDYLLKLAATEEYKNAVKYAREYRELRDTFKGLVEELLRYARENRIDLPQQDRFNRITSKAVSSVLTHRSYIEGLNTKRHLTRKNPSDSEQNQVFALLNPLLKA